MAKYIVKHQVAPEKLVEHLGSELGRQYDIRSKKSKTEEIRIFTAVIWYTGRFNVVMRGHRAYRFSRSSRAAAIQGNRNSGWFDHSVRRRWAKANPR